jgi:eukaryotic-like serine/threonine-protein kinase
VNPPVEIGEVLAGKYRVEHVLGAGGMGVVVAATHLELGQRVAMKFLLAEGMGSPEVAARFMREARAVARMRGEHVARVIDVGKLESGSPYIVMEYLEGLDLEALVRQETVVPIEDAVDYLIQACDAMAEAHRLGIIHRDLKPANLFRSQGVDGQAVIKVLDFGISKSPLDATAGSLTATSALVGSPLYMSPEQMRSSRTVDHRTDIWSLGAVLFELLSGRPPYDGETVGELMAKVLMDPLPSLRSFRAEVPEGLEAVVARCLEKEAQARFANVAELSKALQPYASHRSVMAVERVHRILGSVPPPPAISSIPPGQSSTPPAGGSTPSLSSVQAALVRAPMNPGQSFVGGKTADGEPAGKHTTLGWGSEGKKGGGGGRVAAIAVAAAAAAVAGFLVFRPSATAPVTSPASGAPGTVMTVNEPAVTPAPHAAPVVTPEPLPSASAAPVSSASAPSGSAAPALAPPSPKLPGPRRARPEAAAPETAPPAPKTKDSRLHMELKK